MHHDIINMFRYFYMFTEYQWEYIWILQGKPVTQIDTDFDSNLYVVIMVGPIR